MNKNTHFFLFTFFLRYDCIQSVFASLQLYSLGMIFLTRHYANTPMQYTAIFHGLKNYNFQMKNCDIFLFLLKTLIVDTH